MPFTFKLSRRLAHSRAAVLVLAAAALDACAAGDSSPTGPAARRAKSSVGVVASVSISPSSAGGTIGQSAQFTATARDAFGNTLSGQTFVWSSTDSTIVTVNGTGYATAIGVGPATLVAQDGAVSGSAQVSVSGASVAAIAVSPTGLTGTVGQKGQLTAALTDSAENALTGRRVLWTSSAPGVATVDTTGLATAVAAGSASITAYSGGKSATASVTVTSGGTVTAPGTVTDLGVSGTTDSAATLTFTQVTDGAGQPASYDIRYAVSPIDWGSATTASAGTCAAPLAGTAIGSRLTCTVTGLAPSTAYNFELVAFRGTLNVNAVFGALSNVAAGSTVATASAVASVTVSPSSAAGTVGQAAQFTATVKDASGNLLTSQAVTWSSSNTAVVTVNATGYATAVGAGSAALIATAGGKSGQAAITVTGSTTGTAASVTVSPSTASVAVGGTQQFTATVKDAGGNVLTGQTITWSSSALSVATVDVNGLVTTFLAGTATITATSGGVTGSAALTVSMLPPPPPPSGAWANEPAGFSLISDQAFDGMATLGWNTSWNSNGYVTIVADATAPASPSNVIQFMYPAGFAGGSAPATEYYDHPAYKEVYAGFWWKPSNPWENQISNVNKIAFWFTAGNASIDIQMYGPAPYVLHVVSEYPSGTVRMPPNVTATAVALGQWHKIEWHMKYATSGTSGDGLVEWWMDGVLQGRYTNVQTPSDAGFYEYQFSPTWGGVGGNKSETDYYWFDQVHLSHN